MIGTIEYRLGSKILPAANTTPESLDLQRLFAELNGMGGTHATMEVSSHALALGRVYGLNFHTAVFTNLTRDHLDFHHTMEDYFAAKRLLFTAPVAAAEYSVINRDDEWGRKTPVAGGKSEVLWYGLGQDAMVRARHIHSGFERAAVRGGVRQGQVRDPVAADRQDQRLQHSCGVLRGDDVSASARDDRARDCELPGRARAVRARG